MGDGYTRQSAADIVTGNTIEAGPINAEFNQLRDAFHETSGHAHDGTTGEGPKISLTTSISGILPAPNGGFGGIHKTDAVVPPGVGDDSADGYAPGSHWIDISADKVYTCVDSTLGAAVWVLGGTTTGFQPLDAELTAIAGLTSAADRVPYFTGSGTAALATFTSAGRALVDDADASAQLTTLGVSTFVKTILDDTDAATVRTTIGAQASDADLTALAALSGTNDIYYRSAANTWTSVTIGGNLTFTGGTLDAVASSLDATLASIAALGSGANKGIYFTGVDTAAEYDLTSFARTLLDDTTAAAAATTLGLGTGDSPQFTAVNIGNATDTTITRVSAGVIAVEGVTILTTATGQPLDSDLTSWAGVTRASGFDTFAATPSSANLRSLLTDETGSGAAVFAAAPALTGAATLDGAAIPSISSTNTLTNKRVSARITTITSSATPTVNTDNTDVVNITALAAAITSMTTNLSGTPNIGDVLIYQIKDNGTGRAITWGASFTAKGVALPTTTVANKLLTTGFMWNGSNWGCIGSAQEA